jgi:hypothetical protein
MNRPISRDVLKESIFNDATESLGEGQLQVYLWHHFRRAVRLRCLLELFVFPEYTRLDLDSEPGCSARLRMWFPAENEIA